MTLYESEVSSIMNVTSSMQLTCHHCKHIKNMSIIQKSRMIEKEAEKQNMQITENSEISSQVKY